MCIRDSHDDHRRALLDAAGTLRTVGAHAHRVILLGLAKALGNRAARLEATAASRRHKQWTLWLGISPGALSKLTRNACRWLRGETGWMRSNAVDPAANDEVPDDTGQHDDDDAPVTLDAHADARTDSPAATTSPMFALRVPACAQAEAQREADAWGVQWAVNDDYVDPFPSHVALPPPPPELAAHELDHACRTFPTITGLGADNIAPRALLRLSPQGFLSLATLLNAAERIGDWPELLRLDGGSLSPTAAGGR